MTERKIGDILLKTHKLVKKFGGLTAVKEVSLDVRVGEVVALIGPNGAGKTTFFNCLSQLTLPTSGTITFAGQSLVKVVTPADRQLVFRLSLIFAWLSLLWLPLVLGVVWPDTFFHLESALALTSLMFFRFYLVRPLNNFRPWSRLLLIVFVLVDTVCAAVWFYHSEAFAGVSFFGLFSFYPLLVPGAILLFVGALALLVMFNLPRVKEIFGQHLHADATTRMGMGRTFQNSRLFASLSVLDNVKLGRHCRTKANFFGTVFGLPGTRREELDSTSKATECLRFVGLGEKLSNRAGALAYSDQRRLELARALAIEPKLLLLDEPAAGMNPSESREMIKLLRIISRAGIAILIIEHDLKIITNLADRIFVLDHGELIASGSPAVILNDKKVIDACHGVSHAAAAT